MIHPIKCVYLVLFDNGIKIGMTSNLKNRIQTYKQAWCRPIKEIWYMESQYPRIVEESLLKHFKKNRINKHSEFIINISIEEAIKILNGPLKRSPDPIMILSSYYKNKKPVRFY